MIDADARVRNRASDALGVGKPLSLRHHSRHSNRPGGRGTPCTLPEKWTLTPVFGYFKAKYKESKEKVLEVKSLLDVFEKKYSHELLGEINAVIYREGLGERIGSLSFYARKKGDALLIELGCSSRALVGLEKSESIADAIKKFLRIRAGYVGDYELLPEIPF